MKNRNPRLTIRYWQRGRDIFVKSTKHVGQLEATFYALATEVERGH